MTVVRRIRATVGEREARFLFDTMGSVMRRHLMVTELGTFRLPGRPIRVELKVERASRCRATVLFLGRDGHVRELNLHPHSGIGRRLAASRVFRRLLDRSRWLRAQQAEQRRMARRSEGLAKLLYGADYRRHLP